MNELGKDLCTAAFMGSLSFLEDVLRVSDASTANLRDHMGDTPLHRAVLAGQLECAHVLLENQGTYSCYTLESEVKACIAIPSIPLSVRPLFH